MTCINQHLFTALLNVHIFLQVIHKAIQSEEIYNAALRVTDSGPWAGNSIVGKEMGLRELLSIPLLQMILWLHFGQFVDVQGLRMTSTAYINTHAETCYVMSLEGPHKAHLWHDDRSAIVCFLLLFSQCNVGTRNGEHDWLLTTTKTAHLIHFLWIKLTVGFNWILRPAQY